ncbi:MAG: oxidoreductase [Woeseiaceae bacterium]
MAILWQKSINNTLYEVRTAGQTRRLYTDGVFHSQYNPDRAIMGGIWDLLVLPAFFYPQASIQRVLVLGVGGGAAIHQLQRYIKPEKIIGIELNPIHIKIAKRFFGITSKHAELIEADAIEWISTYSGPPFDMIIDDIFTEEEGEPVRVAKPNKDWFETLNKHLSDDGLLVMNFISQKDFKNCAAVTYKKIAKNYESIFQLTLPFYHNVMGAFLKQSSSSKICRQHINEIKELKNNKKLNFKISQIK